MRDAMLRRSEAANAEWQHISRTNDGKSVLRNTDLQDRPNRERSQRLPVAIHHPITRRYASSPPRRPPKARGQNIPHRQTTDSQPHQGSSEARGSPRPLQWAFTQKSARPIDLAVAGVELPAMMQAGRWDSVRNVSRYISQIQASKQRRLPFAKQTPPQYRSRYRMEENSLDQPT